MVITTIIIIFIYFKRLLIIIIIRYGELVACHPVKAIIACFIATALGGAGLLRFDHYPIIL